MDPFRSPEQYPCIPDSSSKSMEAGIDHNHVPRKRFINKAGSCIAYFREYCNNTSIHGFQYFGEQRTLFEKLWWVLIFIGCFIACSLTIRAVYHKWEDSPVIVSFATKPMKIYDIPFPAITVCSQSKIKPDIYRLEEMNKNNPNLTEKQQKICNYASTICHPLDPTPDYCKSFNFSQDYYEIMEALTPKFYPINCIFLAMPKNCSEIFTPIITDQGLCYTANMLDRHEIFEKNVVHYKNFHKIDATSNWTIEHGYNNKAKAQTHPARALLSGLRYGFQFEIKTMLNDIDTSCEDSLEGYTVLLHIPSRIPRLSQQQYRLSLNKAVVAAINPYTISTASSVQKYSAQKRGCYFASEKKLKYFKIYSQNNCQLECMTNWTLSMCNCVTFFMPRENGTRICGGQDIPCQREAEYHCQATELLETIEGYQNPANVPDCDCMPLCSDIDYNAIISQTDWNWIKNTLNQSKNTIVDNSTDSFMSRFSVYFTTSDFIGSERNELYGPTDFLANFGGLLSLFTGFSILSLMEIIYFLTVRICGNLRLYGFWAGPQKPIKESIELKVHKTSQ